MDGYHRARGCLALFRKIHCGKFHTNHPARGNHQPVSTLKQQFVQFCLDNQILTFGDFTLKSGRKSPYFMNFGHINRADKLQRLGEFYAATLAQAQIPCDVLFGPAYKGIPLATVTALAYYQQQQRALGLAFNRKEAKNHGEGGILVGSTLAGKSVVIIDDVITQGTAIKSVAPTILEQGGHIAAILIAIDREEQGSTAALSACDEVAKTLDTNVMSIISFQDILVYLQEDLRYHAWLPTIRAYREKYGKV